MDLLSKTALTATVITLLIVAGRWMGGHAAGLLAGLPFTTVPALLAVGSEHGAAAAAKVAAGGIMGCALAALFAAVYHAAARRLNPLQALVISIAALAGGLELAQVVQLGLGAAATLAAASGLAALASMRQRASAPIDSPLAPTGSGLWESMPPAMLAGAASAGVAALVLSLDLALAGIVSAMPIIGIATIVMLHATRGRLSVAPYLQGYVLSSMVRAAFCAMFSACAVRDGVLLALLAALVASIVLFGLVVQHRRHMSERMKKQALRP